ncbi:carbohydrate ABC transporter permease [Vibrio sp. WXL103]|uniref:carbohydrate ABC transporter permease n=1 Tax=Vibrio sp. WXL103 TaxID=3450710 RepID=UPI003EC685B9
MNTLVSEAKQQYSESYIKTWMSKNAPYLFVSPFFILFLVFGLFPLLFSFYISFHLWEPASGIAEMEWVGLENYYYAITDEWFHISMYNTIVIGLQSGIPIQVAAICLAFFIHTFIKKWRNTVVGIYFLPYITSTVAVALVFNVMFSKDYGIVNQFLTSLGNFTVLGFNPLAWLFPVENIDWTRPEYTKPMISFVVFWRYLGWNTVLYLSALQTIPSDLYEAAAIDGAKRWKQFWYITLPMLRPMMFFSVTLTIIGSLQLFEEPFIITNGTGGTAQSGKTAAMHLYINGFVEGDFGTASSISWILFLIIAVLTFINHKILGSKQ